MPGSSLARELNELLVGERSQRAPVQLSLGFLPVVSWRLPNLSRLHDNNRLGWDSRDFETWGETHHAGSWWFVWWMIVQRAPEHRLKHPSRNGSEPLTDPWNVHLCRSSNLLHLCQLPTVEGVIHETFEHHSCYWVKALPLSIVKQAVFWWFFT